jgi:ketosteroid isomerase-like protein
MSQENVEIFKRGVEAWNSDDFETWIDQYDPEVEWFAIMEMFRGRRGARQAWETFKGDAGTRVRFDDVRDLGESVLALGEIEITGRRTGLHFAREVAEMVTYRNGKTVCVRDFNSHAEALQAAGLRE